MENYGEKGCFYTRSQARRTGLTCADDLPMTSEFQVHPDPIGAMLEAAPSNWLLEYVCVLLCCISQDLVSSWCVCVCVCVCWAGCVPPEAGGLEDTD